MRGGSGPRTPRPTAPRPGTFAPRRMRESRHSSRQATAASVAPSHSGVGSPLPPAVPCLSSEIPPPPGLIAAARAAIETSQSISSPSHSPDNFDAEQQTTVPNWRESFDNPEREQTTVFHDGERFQFDAGQRSFQDFPCGGEQGSTTPAVVFDQGSSQSGSQQSGDDNLSDRSWSGNEAGDTSLLSPGPQDQDLNSGCLEQTTALQLDESASQTRPGPLLSARRPSLTFQKTLLSLVVSRNQLRKNRAYNSLPQSPQSPSSKHSSPVTSRTGAARRHHSARPGARSSVTFSLPQEEADEEDDEEEDDNAYARRLFFSHLHCSSYRRMSAPELPPIPSRARPTERRSQVGGISSQDGPAKLTLVGIEPRTKGASTRSLQSRQSVGRGSQSSTRLPRQPSEGSSLGNLLQGSKSVSSESGNSSSHPSAPSAPGYLSNRTKSWCTTDKSSGSNFRLETLFEKKSNMSSTLVAKQNSTVNGVRKFPRTSVNGRSSVLGITDSDVRPIEDYSSTTGGGGGGGMRRIQSDNKLLERKKNSRNSNITEKSLSVRKIDPLVKDQPRNGFANRMRKFSSTPAINKVERNEEMEEVTFRTGDDDGEDSETESEKNQRIMEWLVTVEHTAEAPEEPQIDYCDEPPQTDTAVHIVYEGD